MAAMNWKYIYNTCIFGLRMQYLFYFDIQIVYPRKHGVDTEIVFLSRRIAELLGGVNFTTPRGPRYKIRSTVRGLNNMLRLYLLSMCQACSISA